MTQPTATTETKLGRCIAVVGVTGSGKSTLAQQLAEQLNLRYVNNDAIIWNPNWELASDDEAARRFDRATTHPGWTLDGNLNQRDPGDLLIWSRIDTLIWLDLPFRITFTRLLRRTIQRAWNKEELWHGNRESWRLSFASTESILLWSIRTHRKVRQRYLQLLNDPQLAHIQKVHIKSPQQLETWLAELRLK